MAFWPYSSAYFTDYAILVYMLKLLGAILAYGYFDFMIIRLFIKVSVWDVPWYYLLFIGAVLFTQVFGAADYIYTRSRAIKELHEDIEKLKAEIERLKNGQGDI